MIPARSSKNKATSYTDFYKSSGKTPDSADRPILGATGKNDVEDSAEDARKKALRRRLKGLKTNK